jgi:cytochrome b561
MDVSSRQAESSQPVYSQTARRFHWWTALIVLIMIPLGIVMSYEGPAFKLAEVTTGRMNSAHKLLGFVLLWLIVARLFYRIRNGAPRDEPTLTPLQKGVSHATHWALYLLLLAVPLSGWIGVSLYGAREIFGLFSLPPLSGVNQPLSDKVFVFHFWGAMLILALALMHISAGLFHYFIRKDGVLRRMLPRLTRNN